MYLVMSNWARWGEGDTISAGDIAEHVGCLTDQTKPTKAQQRKLGLTDAKGIAAGRIKELIDRGVLRDLDAGERPLKILRPTYEERQAALRNLDLARI